MRGSGYTEARAVDQSEPMQRLLLTFFVCLTGCSGAATGAVASAVINTSIAAASAGVSRSQGGCYASCPVGTTCNGKTGMCDELPCRGRCSANELCDDTLAGGPQCVPSNMPDLLIGKNRDEAARVSPQ
jgi:hypothetical protein